MTEYTFPANIGDHDYNVFPAALESGPNIFFHGTSKIAFDKIKTEGFKHGPVLQSVSFIRTSPLSLRHACEKRSAESPNGAIIAVRFPEGNIRGIRRENEFLYLDNLSIQPEIVGYCIILGSYQFF